MKSVSKKGFDFPKSFAAAIDRQGNILFEVYADGTETDEQKIFHSQLDDAQKPENVNSGETEQQEKKTTVFLTKMRLPG